MRNLDDNNLEDYLREFEPVAPRPLPPTRKRGPLLWAAVFAGVLIALAVFAICDPWRGQTSPEAHGRPKPQQPVTSVPADALTLGKLSAAAQQGDQALELELARSASFALPHMDTPNTALNALSGE
jgi:hypothetical protein